MVYAPRRPDVSGGEGDASYQLARPTTQPVRIEPANKDGPLTSSTGTQRENTSVKMKRIMNPKEKKTFTEFLQIYKDSPCLWDTRRRCYYSREKRKEAYVKLLAKYQEYDEDATCDIVRRKIENMRTVYRRERKKVLTAKRDGENHKPLLWYYELMSFIDVVMEWDATDNKRSFAEIQDRESDTSIENEANAHFDISNPISHSPQEDDDTTHSNKPENSSENFYFVNEVDDDKLSTQSGAHIETCYNGDSSTAFGKMVGLQLKELALEQRIIAEKLISDIIFNARLNRLSDQPPYHNFK